MKRFLSKLFQCFLKSDTDTTFFKISLIITYPNEMI